MIKRASVTDGIYFEDNAMHLVAKIIEIFMFCPGLGHFVLTVLFTYLIQQSNFLKGK